MNELQKRIVAEGRVLPGDIIKVDGFMNHRVDVKLMRILAEEFKAHYAGREITKIMTVEASGIPLATIAADVFDVPLVFAKKAKSDNIEGGLIRSEIFSYTYKKKVDLIVSAEWLSPDDKVLIVDDFMANGEAMRGLVDIISQVGAQLVGVAIAIEKGFQGGGDRLRAQGIDVYSLAVIEHAEPGNIVFRE
ncbi:MAG: xanthine phosphoribosyltransferase [Clostridia bacterium]|nr:xanthine phosphoribosyltransferase [Clostridia bacterium]MBR6108497.1 xanthine phosphoribosyltransferase [Clostridia bacterium]